MAGLTVMAIAGSALLKETTLSASPTSEPAASPQTPPQPSTNSPNRPGNPNPAGRPPTPIGDVGVSDEAAIAKGPLAPSSVHTQDGAVAAFTAFATWLLASPAARDEPQLAVQEVSGGLLNSADAQTIVAMRRSPGDTFAPADGGYRVLGYSGSANTPRQVMVEIVAPATFSGSTRWLVVGGVVAWSGHHWDLVSIRPREIEQPLAARRSADELSDLDRARVFAGLGWRSFASATN